jgi:hypothetical protein
VNALNVRLSPVELMLPACTMVMSAARAKCPGFTDDAKVPLTPLRLKQAQPPGGSLLRA